MSLKDARERWPQGLPSRPLCLDQRHYLILARAVAKFSSRAIAKDHQITSQRVCQIVKLTHQRLTLHLQFGPECPRCKDKLAPRPKPVVDEKQRRLDRANAMRRRLDDRARKRAAGLLVDPVVPHLDG